MCVHEWRLHPCGLVVLVSWWCDAWGHCPIVGWWLGCWCGGVHVCVCCLEADAPMVCLVCWLFGGFVVGGVCAFGAPSGLPSIAQRRRPNLAAPPAKRTSPHAKGRGQTAAENLLPSGEGAEPEHNAEDVALCSPFLRTFGAHALALWDAAACLLAKSSD